MEKTTQFKFFKLAGFPQFFKVDVEQNRIIERLRPNCPDIKEFCFRADVFSDSIIEYIEESCYEAIRNEILLGKIL